MKDRFQFLTGQTIDLDTIQAIDYYRDNPLVQKAVKELARPCRKWRYWGRMPTSRRLCF
mgnify:CR=1 FL=1